MTTIDPTMSGYRKDLLSLASDRGWNREQHQLALDEDDELSIILTHPYNLVTEAELASPEQLTLWGDE